jgi:hypothetical protein
MIGVEIGSEGAKLEIRGPSAFLTDDVETTPMQG